MGSLVIAWGGYRNGEIPASAMQMVMGVLAEPTAARQMALLKRDHDKATGRNLGASWGFRSFAYQDAIFRDRYYVVPGKTNIRYDGRYWRKRGGVAIAAIPRTSNHGYGKSFDLTDYDLAWLRANAWKYGFEADVPSESWHWTLRRTPIILAGPGAPAPETPTTVGDDDMWQVIPSTSNKVYLQAGGRYVHIPNEQVLGLVNRVVAMQRTGKPDKFNDIEHNMLVKLLS